MRFSFSVPDGRSLYREAGVDGSAFRCAFLSSSILQQIIVPNETAFHYFLLPDSMGPFSWSRISFASPETRGMVRIGIGELSRRKKWE